MAGSIVYHGYEDWFGVCRIRFSARGTMYTYEMDCRNARKCDWIAKKSEGRAFQWAQKHCWRWRKEKGEWEDCGRKSSTRKIAHELVLIAKELVSKVRADVGDKVIVWNQGLGEVEGTVISNPTRGIYWVQLDRRDGGVKLKVLRKHILEVL